MKISVGIIMVCSILKLIRLFSSLPRIPTDCGLDFCLFVRVLRILYLCLCFLIFGLASLPFDGAAWKAFDRVWGSVGSV